MKTKYKFGFQVWGLVLFGIVILPTIIWSVVPAPNDVLRADSITPMIDRIGSIFQVIMIALLCIMENTKAKTLSFSKWLFFCIVSVVFYFVSWIFYYRGMVHPVIILGLTVPPCLSFFFFAMDRKNYFAISPIVLFTICHFIYGVKNFIL